MIDTLPESEKEWLSRFFAEPNRLTFASLIEGSVQVQELEQIERWLQLFSERPSIPIVLPFARSDNISGWYAAAQGSSSSYELRADIQAWLGPTWLSVFEQVAPEAKDPMAMVLRSRFGDPIYRFTGKEVDLRQISVRLGEYLTLLEHRPPIKSSLTRPVGAILSDFEGALLAGAEEQARKLIDEVKRTGRLNEENLKQLDVRLNAGLGLWPNIARYPSLIRQMSELKELTPQILADLIEALYRVHIDDEEAVGNSEAIQEKFKKEILEPFPSLFKSRRGIRTPRVLKAFLLFEGAQDQPNHKIIETLLELLPEGTNKSLFVASEGSNEPRLAEADQILLQAEEAFDKGWEERAFELYITLKPTEKIISRSSSCVRSIQTTDAKILFLKLVDRAEPGVIDGLSPVIADRIDKIRQGLNDRLPQNTDGVEVQGLNPWIDWAERLALGKDLDQIEKEVRETANNWDVSGVRDNFQEAEKFAGILNDDASESAQRSVPYIFRSFFPDDEEPRTTAKPIAQMLFLLIVTKEGVSGEDVTLLDKLVGILIEQGLSAEEYVGLISDLKDKYRFFNEYGDLPCILDLCERLAVSRCPPGGGHEARKSLFEEVLLKVSGFSHRLNSMDLVPIEFLAEDFDADRSQIAALRRNEEQEDTTNVLPTMEGKTIGIYTLEEAAGKRAKLALEKLFPSCRVLVNSDHGNTEKLESLARGADLFVFAWKSSKHAAYYSVKDAVKEGALLYAPGKGTASILRSVQEHLTG